MGISFGIALFRGCAHFWGHFLPLMKQSQFWECMWRFQLKSRADFEITRGLELHKKCHSVTVEVYRYSSHHEWVLCCSYEILETEQWRSWVVWVECSVVYNPCTQSEKNVGFEECLFLWIKNWYNFKHLESTKRFNVCGRLSCMLKSWRTVDLDREISRKPVRLASEVLAKSAYRRRVFLFRRICIRCEYLIWKTVEYF